jgi:hypothetical protein
MKWWVYQQLSRLLRGGICDLFPRPVQGEVTAGLCRAAKQLVGRDQELCLLWLLDFSFNDDDFRIANVFHIVGGGWQKQLQARATLRLRKSVVSYGPRY